MANAHRIDCNLDKMKARYKVSIFALNEAIRTGNFSELNVLKNHIEKNHNIRDSFLILCSYWFSGEFADEGLKNPFSKSKVKRWLKEENLPSKNQMKKIIKEQIPKLELAISNLNEREKEKGDLDG